ncbi:MAG: hypothetical protein IJ298_05415 [Ruminococcus sp.]|nr:hypothetical protein [Ruminococcus sp.]
MNEFDAWNAFIKTGSIQDYLNYKAVQNTAKPQDNTDEDSDRRTNNQTTEYR